MTTRRHPGDASCRELAEGGTLERRRPRPLHAAASPLVVAAPDNAGGEAQSPIFFVDQAKANQVSHVTRRQKLGLRNAQSDTAQGNFLVRTEGCNKATFHIALRC